MAKIPRLKKPLPYDKEGWYMKQTSGIQEHMSETVLVLKKPEEIIAQANFAEELQEARRKADDFADAHRVTSDLLKIEFCV